MQSAERPILLVACLVLWWQNAGASFQAAAPDELARRLDDYLARLERFGFSGAVLAAKKDEIILNKGYGWADKENAIANSAETVFSTGSITKQFTAAAILKLEMQHKLKTNDALSKYLANVPEDKRAITLHHLLSHTSGLAADEGGGAAPDREQFVRETLQRPLQSTPGENFEYSNAGYGLLAAIIEEVSGQTYEQYLRENLFKPAGMLATGYRMPQWDAPRVAHWYVGEIDHGSPLRRPFPNWTTLGSGEILSTTTDMFKWHQALLGDTMLSAAAKKKLYTPVLHTYAYGWDITPTPFGTMIHHDGGNTLGVGADFRRFVEAGVVIIAFCNDRGETMLLGETRKNITRIVLGKEVEMPPAVAAIDTAALGKYEGNFSLPSGAKIDVAKRGRALVLSGEGQEAVSLLATGDSSTTQILREKNALVMNLIKASAEGNHRPVFEAFKDALTFEAVQKRQSQSWREWRENMGEYKSCRVLGTLAEGEEDQLTYARLDFERGVVFLRFFWGPFRLAGIRPVAAPAGKGFFHESANVFVSFDIPSARTTRLRFNVNEKGAVAGLALACKGGEFVAGKNP